MLKHCFSELCQNRAGHSRGFVFASWKKLLTTILGLGVCVAGHAQGTTTLAYDGFNYSAGSLAGQNGGTGWAGAWAHLYTSGASFNVSASGMSYSGLSTSGGSIVWGSGGNGISEDTRSLTPISSGLVYIQFLGQFGSTSGGGTPSIRLLNSASLTGGIGGNGGTYGSTVSILDNTLSPAANGSSSSSASLSALNLVVLRIDYQNFNTMLWVNPDLSTFNYANPTAPNATYANLAPAFDSVAIYSRSPGQVDELKIMS